jgi:hypothetical protein
MQVIDVMPIFRCRERVLQGKNAFFPCFQGIGRGILPEMHSRTEPREVSGGRGAGLGLTQGAAGATLGNQDKARPMGG